MTYSTKAIGIMQALVERLEKQRLPMALEIQERVSKGGLLNDFDIQFLTEVFQDAAEIQPLLDAHPEWQDLAARMAHLYHEITNQALENEKRNQQEG